MKKHKLTAVLRRVAVVVFAATLPISLPYRAFELLEGDDRGRNTALALFLLEFLAGLSANLAGLSGIKVCAFLLVCAIFAGFSMEVVHAIWGAPEKKPHIRQIRPSLCVKSVLDISARQARRLRKAGFKLIVFDLDHTLTSAESWRVTVKVRRRLKELQEMGFELGCLTNTIVPWREKRARVIVWSTKIKRIVLVCCNGGNCKPKEWGFREVCRQTGVAPGKAVMVGDLLGRDIEGAIKAGYGFTILVEPDGPDNMFVLRARRQEWEIKEWLAEIGLLRL